jgi:hypothetical protein
MDFFYLELMLVCTELDGGGGGSAEQGAGKGVSASGEAPAWRLNEQGAAPVVTARRTGTPASRARAGREREERESLGESGREGAEIGRSTYREGRERETPGEVKGRRRLLQLVINGAC